MRLLAKAGIDAHLHLFGDGRLRGWIDEERSRLDVEDRVSLHGYADLDTAAAYLRACDALVIPSRIESIPVVLSDGVQSGIPIVATDVGDQGRLVRQYQLGEVVAPKSAAAIAEGIQRVLESDRSRFVTGMRLAAAELDVRRAARHYLAAAVRQEHTITLRESSSC